MANLNNLKKAGKIYTPASEDNIKKVESDFGFSLPNHYRALLALTNGAYLDSGVKIYSTDEIVERNETYQVKKFASEYLMVGDDSGGRGIVISQHEEPSSVFIVDMGFIDPDYMDEIGDTFETWVSLGCLTSED